MTTLVTGSAGHLGEALVRTLRRSGERVVGTDIQASAFTDTVGSITDPGFVAECVAGCDYILHSATLHKPHVATHSRQAFIDTNVSGTLNLLEAAANESCKAFVFTSTTSTFGDAMKSGPGEPAVWVTEALKPQPRNIYGVTKLAAESLCELFHRQAGLPCVVLRTSRFFPEEDDSLSARERFDSDNLKVSELTFRRVDIADVVSAHLLALNKAATLGFDRFVISGTTPFGSTDAEALGVDAAAVLARRAPQAHTEFQRRGWSMLPRLDRVYDNARAVHRLGWTPEFTFDRAIDQLAAGGDYRSPLSIEVGSKGYHAQTFDGEPYPVAGF